MRHSGRPWLVGLNITTTTEGLKMNFGTLTCITSLIVFANLMILIPLGAQNEPEKETGHVRYVVKELPTLGGAFSMALVVLPIGVRSLVTQTSRATKPS